MVALPVWRQMSELDRAEAFHHVDMTTRRHKSWREWPCRYVDEPVLALLTPAEAHWHAVQVVPTLTDEQEGYLHEVWVHQVEPLRESRHDWGVRYEGDPQRLWTTSNETFAWHSFQTSTRTPVELLRRYEPGGVWHIVDSRGGA